MMRQGYRDHLANVHLDQDPRDLRQHGEQTLFSFRGQRTSEDSEGVRNKNNENAEILLLVILVENLSYLYFFYIRAVFGAETHITGPLSDLCTPDADLAYFRPFLVFSTGPVNIWEFAFI